MATDSTGVTLLAKCQLDNDGFPTTDGTQLFIPHVNQSYDAYLFPSENEADNNDTVNAKKVAHNASSLPKQAAVYFDSVDSLKLSSLQEGTVCFTESYYLNGDSVSSAKYTIKTLADYGGTPDELRDFTISNGNVAAIAHDGTINVMQCGAKGDGVTDDYLSLQSANLSGIGYVFYPKNTYETTETVQFRSRIFYEGCGVGSIIHSGVDKVICASEGWVDPTASTDGAMTIKSIQIRGEKSLTNQIALVVRDYFSSVLDVNAVNAGGGGIHTTHLSSDGTAVGGSLVENKIQDCTVRTCGGTLYDFGAFGNQKITDGFFINCIAFGEQGLTDKIIYCGQSAGWIFDGFHTYGAQIERPIEIVAPSNTHIINFYIESFIDRGITISNAQGNVVVRGSIKGNGMESSTDPDICYVSISRAGVVNPMNINLDIVCAHTKDVEASGLFVIDSGITGNASIVARSDFPSKFTNVRGLNDNTNLTAKIAQPTQFGVTEDEETGRLLNGNAFPVCWTAGRLQGNSAHTIAFDLPRVSIIGGGKLILDVTIMANRFDNGGSPIASYKAMVMITGKFEDNIEHNVLQIVAPTGFSSAPVFSVLNDTDPDEAKLQCVFTWSDSESTGTITAIGTTAFGSGITVTST